MGRKEILMNDAFWQRVELLCSVSTSVCIIGADMAEPWPHLLIHLLMGRKDILMNDAFWHDIILVTSSYHRNSLFQCIGAVLGAGILHGCTPTPVADTLGANGLGSINVSGVSVSVTPEAGHHCDLISKAPMNFIIRFCSWGIADHALGPRCLCNCCW